MVGTIVWANDTVTLQKKAKHMPGVSWPADQRKLLLTFITASPHPNPGLPPTLLQESCGETGESPAGDCWKGQDSEAHDVPGKSGGGELIYHGEDKAKGWFNNSLKRSYRGIRVTLYLATKVQQRAFAVTSSLSVASARRGCGVSRLWGFQDVARKSHTQLHLELVMNVLEQPPRKSLSPNVSWACESKLRTFQLTVGKALCQGFLIP